MKPQKIIDTQQSLKQNPTPFERLLALAWQRYTNHFIDIVKIFVLPVIGGIALIIVLGLLFLIFLPQAAAPTSPDIFIISVIIILTLLFIVLGVLFEIWPIVTFLNYIKIKTSKDSQPISIIELYKRSAPLILPLLWIILLNSLVVLGGFILLIIPGIIFSVWFMFSQFALIFENIRGAQALLRSKELVIGHWWRIFFYSLIFSGGIFIIHFFIEKAISFTPKIFYLLLSLALNIFFLTPLLLIFFYVLYKDLLRFSSLSPSLAQHQSPKWIYGTALLSVILIILLVFIIVPSIIDLFFPSPDDFSANVLKKEPQYQNNRLPFYSLPDQDGINLPPGPPDIF